MKGIYVFVALVAVVVAVPTGSEDKNHKSDNHPPNVAFTKAENKTESQTSTTTEAPSTTLDPAEAAKRRCSQLIGKFINGKFVGLEVTHDLAKLLEKYGGPPGKVNATQTQKEDAPVKEEDEEKRPLPDAEEKYWIYKYGDTDSKTYIRIEHAVNRFTGTPKAFTEVRGILYFTPEDFCGDSRKAYYTLDDRGFTFEVSREYCSINSQTVSCAQPAHCTQTETTIKCVAAPSTALLAALVGGGK